MAQATHADRPPALARPALALERLSDAGTWIIAFALVVYLGLKGGGYDTVVHGEVGVALWWLVAVGALAGVLPRARVGAPAAAALALIGALAAWTAIGIGASESAERSAADLARLATYAGILAVAVCVQGRGALRATVNGLAAGIGLIAALAVLSRLHPSWFPDSATADFLPGARKRLAYPLNYWNAVAAMMAIGVPLLLAAAASARTLAAQALAAAALPLALLAAMLTLSRGGAVAVVLAALVYLALAPDPLRALATLAVGGAGGAILIGAVLQRHPLRDALPTRAARADGDEVLAMAIVVCAGVALVHVAIALWARQRRRTAGAPLRGPAVAALAGIALAAVAITVVATGAWSDFKRPRLSAAQEFAVGRFGEASGSGRYQYWTSALDAAGEHPLRGTGAGTYGFWWSRHGDYWYGVNDAHSLYLEKLAEQGIPGFVLIVGLVGLVLWAGVRRCLRAPPDQRALLAAATAGFSAFAWMTAIDWVWEIAAVSAAALLLAAVMLVPTDAPPRPAGRRGSAGWALTAALVLAGVAAAVAILPPVSGTAAVRESRAAAARQRFRAAFDAAARAERAQPYAATPRLQHGLLLERTGNLEAAAAAVGAAARDEPTNFRPWLVLSRIEAERGHADAAVRAFRRARELNPHSPALGGR